MAHVILLNGCSSAGKTTLAVKLQQLLPEPYQYIGLDQYRDGMPERVRGLNAPPGTEGMRGLNVVPQPNNQTAIQFGDFGDLVLRNMRQSVAQFSNSGIPVIIDDLLLKPEYIADYIEFMDPTSCWLIGVQCDLSEVEAREASRPGRFPGTAAEHYNRVHEFVDSYDLIVDTSNQSPRQLAREVILRLEQPPTALQNLLVANR
ncbi:MAG: chloramphenicol 3-O phosphotransferase [Limisphaerales bacterium]|jgi:chloramphenicol 3-O phosphotransferase